MQLPRLLLAVGALVIGAGLHDAFAGVREGYKSPTFAIPYAVTKPTIDGNITDAEWKSAFSFNGLQNTEGKISVRQATFFLQWDEDNLYVAMRSPLRDGERLIQARRNPERDDNKVIFDDCYEIWVNANTTSPDSQKVFFQYLGNIAGARYDVMFEPSVGNSRPGWTAGWKPANRVTSDGKIWEMELAIPRTTLFKNEPLAEGTELSTLLVRNFKRPWDQCSVGGSGSFSALDTHAKLLLSKSAPGIHVDDVADIAGKTFGLAMDSTDAKVKWSVQSDGGESAGGEGNVSKLDITKPGSGDYRITVKSADDKPLVEWVSKREFTDHGALSEKINDDGKNMLLELVFNPVENFLRVDGDLIDFDRRGEIKKFVASVSDASGKTLVEKELTLDDLAYVRGLLVVGDCPAGKYTARLTCLDGGGNVVIERKSDFEKKDPATFSWWNTKTGDAEKVLAPWTPVTLDMDRATTDGGPAVAMWGREIVLGLAGMPASIKSQGDQMLAAPAMIEIDGVPLAQTAKEFKFKKVSAADNRAVVESTAQSDNFTTTSVVTTEYDGLYKIEMTINPSAPVNVQSLKVRVPLKPSAVDFYHASGEGIRYGFDYGSLPSGTGQLWNSKKVDGQPMLVGSFLPFVWLGNDKAGLAWFADSDEGWVPSNKTPAIEIRKDSDQSVDLVLNLISEPFTIDKPRKITFAFQATPVKQLHKGWRMDTWWTGDSFKDWSQLESEGNTGDMGLIFSALPFPLNPKKSREMADARHQETTYMGIPKYKANAVPYFENILVTDNRKRLSPEIEYFADQWNARVSSAMIWDKSSTDYVIWNLDKWITDSDIDGWYIDNVRPIACDNIDAGRGYRLPDGRVQPTYQIFDTRVAFLRIRAVFLEHNKPNKFVLHMTNNFVIPWLGTADLALDGEDHVIFPDMGKDFMDFWSLDRMRLAYWQQWGVAVIFLKEYQGPWNQEPARYQKVMRAFMGATILNDIHPGANPDGGNPEIWKVRDDFGIEADDVEFIPYWRKDSGLKSEGENFYASAWKRPGKVMIAVVNRGEDGKAKITVDLAKLGVPAGAKAIDAESNEEYAMDASGTFVVPVTRHDYRSVIIATEGK